ncbi:patatin-like phospholipase family protein [Alteromonadaceae bacterium M269]|nr:patatin-like phospholipase family protein [Alteromonadaceae bacterium M269]
MERNQFALLLSGGGARAAYQVGVLKAIATFLPRNHSIPFPVICGNSAGALNATSLACYASCYHLGVRKLDWIWRNFRTDQVYQTQMGDVLGYLVKHGLRRLQSDQVQNSPSSLLNNQPLRQLLRKTLNFHRIDRNILSGHLRAISIMGSNYSNHESISFYQSHKDIQPWVRQKRRGVRTIINIEHLMASSAIPVVFPTVKIGDEFYGDGSVHQLSPLSAPIHLGAEKILVIGVEQPNKSNQFKNTDRYPSTAAVAGHLLDTIFSDTLSSDIERMERINDTLDLLTARQKAKTDLKPIECMVVNPSRNFTELANEHYYLLPAGIRAYLKVLGVKPDSESSLLSYLLFEKEFCQQLIDIGYQDGLDRQEELRSFLEI